jgi:ATPase subunit of ABC transporter with duplicated ATPase domains
MIFLDEPSNDLDLNTLLWLENYIITSPKTILFVSHDEDFLSRTATKIIHLESVKKKALAQTKVEELTIRITHRSANKPIRNKFNKLEMTKKNLTKP